MAELNNKKSPQLRGLSAGHLDFYGNKKAETVKEMQRTPKKYAVYRDSCKQHKIILSE